MKLRNYEFYNLYFSHNMSERCDCGGMHVEDKKCIHAYNGLIAVSDRQKEKDVGER
jgi:hypothetical protein